VAREAARVEASSRDHSQVEIGRIELCARPPAPQELLLELSQAVSAEVEILAPEAGLAATLPASQAALFQHFGATVAGVASNSGKQR
jgi:hypothetical protein